MREPAFEPTHLDLDALILELDFELKHPILCLCKAVLENEYGYEYEQVGDNELRFEIHTTMRRWRSQFITSEAPMSVVRLWIYPDLPLFEKHVPIVREFAARLNGACALGGWGFDWDANALFFRHSHHFLNKPDAAVINDMLAVTALPLTLCYSAAAFIIDRGATVKAAFEAAMVKEALAEWQDVSPEAKKLLIHALS